MKVKLIADSSSDTFELEGMDFTLVPLNIATDERAFVDDINLNVPQMMDYLAHHQGRSYTACPNVDAWCRAYRGGDEIYVVTISSNLSGSYGAAVSAAQIYKEENPDAKIHVFDSLSAGPEVRMLVKKIARLKQEGKSFEETCLLGEEYKKSTRIFFSLQSFHNLAMNGRVSKAVAKIGGMLGIRIMATGSETGTIEIVDKCRGEKSNLKKFMENLEKAGYTGGNISLAHCQNLTFAQLLANEIRSVYPEASIEIYETRGLCSYYAEAGGTLLSFEC